MSCITKHPKRCGYQLVKLLYYRNYIYSSCSLFTIFIHLLIVVLGLIFIFKSLLIYVFYLFSICVYFLFILTFLRFYRAAWSADEV